MGLDVNIIQPTPSDFADFVYCGVKWAIRKNKLLDINNKPRNINHYSKKVKRRHDDLLFGRKNEYKCIEWVLKNNRASKRQILFNGTGEKNHKFLTSEVKSLGIKMQCKPDLIIKDNNLNLLFEFKAVSDMVFLLYPEFDSNHAQVWCYTTLKEIRIDSYYLIRYYIDPFEDPLTECKQLTPSILDHPKFELLFKRYNEVIKILKEMDNEIKQGQKPIRLDLDMFNKPKEEDERQIKCSHCRYNRDVCKMNLKRSKL